MTSAENTRRAEINVGRKGKKLKPRTHCPAGHPYDEVNSYIRSSGKRVCRSCAQARRQRYRREQRQAQVLLLRSAPVARPSTVPAVFRAAARLIVANGHYQGDYLPDPFDREMCIPHFLRPMSIVAALKCVATGDPHTPSLLADEAISVLALRLQVNGEQGPFYGGTFDLEDHVAAWGDVEGRSVESVVAVLEAAADASEAVAL